MRPIKNDTLQNRFQQDWETIWAKGQETPSSMEYSIV